MIEAVVEPFTVALVTPVEPNKLTVPAAAKVALMASTPETFDNAYVLAAPTVTFNVSVPSPPKSVSATVKVWPAAVTAAFAALNISLPEVPVKLSALVVSVR